MMLKPGNLHEYEILVADEQHDDLLTGNTGCIFNDTAFFITSKHIRDAGCIIKAKEVMR